MKRQLSRVAVAAARIVLAAGLAVPAMGQPCGSGWAQRANGGPGGGSGRPLAYDTLRSRLVMFAGNNTWEWDGQAWSLRATTGPSSRDRLGLAFDGAHIIMFGGGGSVSTPLSETWQWDGVQWTQLIPATVPRARFSPGMVYDPIRQTVVMFGGDGYSEPQYFSDTWEWSRATGNWTQQPISGPQSSLVYGAYDTSRSCVTVWVGGANPLWRRSSTGTDAWQSVPIGFGPPSAGGLVFDQSRNTVVVTEWQWFSAGVSTWELGSSAWGLRYNGAPNVASRSMAYDPVRQRTVLVSDMGQTWEWDGLASGPAILSSPRDAWFSLGGSATISVTASGPGLSYQWRAGPQPLANGGHFSGVNTPDLTIDSATLLQLNLYSCLVSNACGSVASPGTQLRVRCWVNCDGSTSSPLLSAEDFQCYLNEFAAGSSYANCDGSTAPPILNINDFNCFLNKYAARDCN